MSDLTNIVKRVSDSVKPNEFIANKKRILDELNFLKENHYYKDININMLN